MPTKKVEEESVEPRRLLVFQGDKSFLITVPQDARTTFGPWSPPNMATVDRWGGRVPGRSDGTLRVYGRTKEHVLAVFSGVTGFRDLSLEYVEVESGFLEKKSEDEEPYEGESVSMVFDDSITLMSGDSLAVAFPSKGTIPGKSRRV